MTFNKIYVIMYIENKKKEGFKMATFTVRFTQQYEVEANNCDEAIEIAEKALSSNMRSALPDTLWDEMTVEDEYGEEIACGYGN